MPNTKVLTLALAAILALGTLDAASARSKKHPVTGGNRGIRLLGQSRADGERHAGHHERLPPASAHAGGGAAATARRPSVEIPRGSGTYIPPPNPSPYSRNSPPAAALTGPAPAPYIPPPINTFSDRVTGAIHAYPLEKGIGNNPIDQQQFIRQRANQ